MGNTYLFHIIAGCMLLQCFCFRDVISSKVLFFNGMGEGSHYFAAAALAEELHAKGHSITFILSSVNEVRAKDPLHRNMFEFRIFDIGNTTKMDHHFEYATIEGFKGDNAFKQFNFMQRFLQDMAEECQAVFRDESFLQSLRDAHFDLMVCDPMWLCTLGVGELLKLEKVALVPMSSSPALVRLLGGTTSPAISPEFYSGFPQKMTFLQRCLNLLTAMITDLITVKVVGSLEQFGISDYQTALTGINVYILATDPVFDLAIPEMPGHVVASGLTIKTPRLLEGELEAFVQSAREEGVIIFSLGSYITHMPDEFVEMFREAFSKLQQNVVWQWKNELPLENMPKNVYCMDWLPQQDLLAHKQTKLLIYQGGINGVYEAIHYEVPILVLPLLADQFDIAQRIVERGIGLQIDARNVTSDQVVEMITTLLTQKKYKDNISRMAAIIRDKPQTSRERAAFMIEHVLKFGSTHLRSPAHDLNFIQLHMIDVHLFLLICTLLVLLVLYGALRLVLKLFMVLCCEKRVKVD